MLRNTKLVSTCYASTEGVSSLWVSVSKIHQEEGYIMIIDTNNMEKRYRIGIDLGGTNIKVGIVDDNNTIIKMSSTSTLVNRSYHEIIKSMAEETYSLLDEENISITSCSYLGIGSPGLVNSKSGVVEYSNNFGWENVPVLEELRKYFDIPLYISNDANCAVLGEVVAGAAKGCDNVVLLTLGTGIGSGIILNGKLFEGGHTGGAEFGHNVLIANGEVCTCGRKGCYEAYASATALIRDTKRAALQHKESLINVLSNNDLSRVTGKTAFKAMVGGDPAAIEVISNYIKYLSEGIINVINLLRPDKVLISGGVCNQGDILTKPVNAYVKKYCFAKDRAYTAPVTIAALGNLAGIIGAASLQDYS